MKFFSKKLFTKKYYSKLLASPATKPIEKAACKLYPPVKASTSTTSPTQYKSLISWQKNMK